MKSNYIEELINKYQEKKLDATNMLDIKESGIYRIDLINDKVQINIGSHINVILKVYIKVSNIKIKLIINNDSNVGYYIINEAEMSETDIDILENAYIETYDTNISEKSQTIFTANLIEYNAAIDHNVGLYLIDEENHYYQTKINHFHASTFSNINKNVVLNNHANCTLDIESYIKKNSSKANAYQKSKIINLSDTTTAKINPILLIDDYDVMGGHGATITKVSDEDLYYMQSRGIKIEEALKLITLGHLLENAPKYMKEEITLMVERRMSNERI